MNETDNATGKTGDSGHLTTTVSAETTRKPYPKSVRVLATVVSYIFHPVFLPTAMTVVICWLDVFQFAGISDSTKWHWVRIAAYLTIFFPLFTVFLIWKLKFAGSIFLKTQRDRIAPYMAIMIYYFWVYQVFERALHAPLMLQVMFLGCFWGIIVLFLVNIFFKISMHTAAAGGMIGMMLILMFTAQINFLLPFLIALLIAGAIGTARMILNAHSSLEIWLGYAAGFIAQICAYWFLK